MRFAVIGAGSWGSAVAWLLGSGGHTVCQWARNSEVACAINGQHRNPRYLSDVELPASISATLAMDEALGGADAVVMATPSSAVRTAAKVMAAYVGKGSAGAATPILLLSKGIEHDSGELLLDVLASELGTAERLAVLSGPNHAEEVARGMLCGTVIAANRPEVAAVFQEALACNSFRVYTSEDCIGVQLCGAAKNPIAIAAGVAQGLELGDNTAAMLMTRGLAEISRLVQAVGGQARTCMGLAGMGDLVVTCTSPHSRNRSFGEALAAGQTLADYERQTHMVVEGALACRSLPALAAKHGVALPITEQVRNLVWGGGNIDALLADLLERPFKPEFY